MRIRMTRTMTGTVRGLSLPRRGTEIDVDDKLAVKLCEDGLAVPVPDTAPVEARPAPEPDVETRPAPSGLTTSDVGSDEQPEDGPDASTVRAWALSAGLDVPDRGRLPQALYDAYRDAHS